jgi:polysaccharide pyruvyl transferase WcaK-like protein
MYDDYYYAKEFCGNGLVFIDPSIEALDDLLRSEGVDFVGTRLHGGIRALQHKRRTIIIAVDNRATEIGRDINLPIVQRTSIAQQLENRINDSWRIEVNVDQQAVVHWKRQFLEMDE